MENSIAKELPHNLEAERSVLGAILLDSNTILKVISILPDPAHFFLSQNRLIYRAMQSLMANSEPIDTVTLTESLSSAGNLDAAGAASYLSQLPDGIPRAVNIEQYARIVRQKAFLRELIYVAEVLQNRALDALDDPGVLLERAISDLLEVRGDGSERSRAREWQEVAHSAVDQLASERLHPEKRSRIFFGIKSLDEMTSGLRRKELCVIVAPTSNGKTLLASQCATQASRDGFKALYFSAEMPAEQLAIREIAYRARVKFYYTQRPENLNTDELARLSTAAAEPVNVRIIDRDVTPSRIWAMAEATKQNSGLDLIVIDYDQLVIEAGMDPKSDDESIFKHQRNFMISAKRLAERLDICVLLLCQLRKIPTKVAAGSVPHLDDIWGDSSVRNTPHLILWLVRDFFQHNMDVNFERKAHVHVMKARNGRTGTVPLEFDPDSVRFLHVPEDNEGAFGQ